MVWVKGKRVDNVMSLLRLGMLWRRRAGLLRALDVFYYDALAADKKMREGKE
jgi:hypothetical protein